MSVNGTLDLTFNTVTHALVMSYRVVMPHYDPLDQHDLVGVFWIFLPLGHLHHLITSHPSYIKSILLGAYLRTTASFQL